MTLEEMLKEANNAIRNAPPSSTVYVGCDSIREKKKKGWTAKYSMVVIVHKSSNNGGRIFHHTTSQEDFGILRMRLMKEAEYAIQVVDGIIDSCLEMDIPIQVHLDLNPNPNYKSHIVVKEACGWVRAATGIDAVIKPDSFASKSAADAVCKGRFTTDTP